jgi:hypothetical protein
MAADLRQLYWPGPFRGVYQQLQAANAASEPRLRELLAGRQDWLLLGLAKFQAPSDASRRAAQDAFKAGKLVLSAAPAGEKGGGQRVTVEPRLEQAALELSAILVRTHSMHARPGWVLRTRRRGAGRGRQDDNAMDFACYCLARPKPAGVLPRSWSRCGTPRAHGSLSAQPCVRLSRCERRDCRPRASERAAPPLQAAASCKHPRLLRQ